MKKRLFGVLLVLAMVLVGCSGKPGSETSGNGNSVASEDAAGGTQESQTEGGGAAQLEPVTLKFYFIGEPAADNEKVFAEINRILKEKINATIEPVYLSWGDWDQRYPGQE